MKAGAIAAACALTISAPLAADGGARCFIEVGKLVAPPPAGVGELTAAIRQLDDALRPQVDEIKQLKTDLAALDRRQQAALTSDGDEDLVALDEERKRLDADLEAKHAALKADFAERQKTIVGPVQARIARTAQAFGTERGCSKLEMARAPDLAALSDAGARDLTGEFVAWYGQDPG